MSQPVRKRKKKSKNQYFTQATEDAIVRYNNSTDPEERSEIYRKDIHYAFFKLTENIIHTFKFYYTDGLEDLEDLKHELVIFFHSKLDRFKPENGKAFSYFSLAGKRWLIAYNEKNYKKLINKANTDEIDEQHSILIEGEVESNRNDGLAYFHHFVESFEENIDNIFKKDIEKEVANALVLIFKNRNSSNLIIKKKALWIYIREITKISNEDTHIITRVVKKSKKYYEKNFESYLKSIQNL